jgi:hypothetical protein
VEVADLLQSLANRLRQQRAVRQIEVDSGWWEDRDVTIVHQTWFRLDVRALVEDHGGGNCRHRLAIRTNLTTAAALPLLVAVGTAAALRYGGVPWTAGLPLVAAMALVIGFVSVLSASRVVLRALDSVTAGFGMSFLPSPHARRTDAKKPAAMPAEPAGLTLTTRAMADESPASRAYVGDL